MRVIGFNYTKLHAERLSKLEKTDKITANIEFLDIEKDALEVMKESDVLKANFKYEVNYDPSNAKILCEGSLILMAEKEEIKNIIKQWKKKQMDDKTRLFLTNVVWRKCTMKAFSLEEDLNLQPHVRIPHIAAAPQK